MWATNSVFYQIYPLGFCGAPKSNDGQLVPRIRKVVDWIPHIKKLNVDAIYFSPVFESDRHGYDTRDYTKIDCRLGSNEDFAFVCKALRENGIRVEESDSWIDKKHLEYWDECIDKNYHVEMSMQVSMIPHHIANLMTDNSIVR